jgi:hypothetical protein
VSTWDLLGMADTTAQDPPTDVVAEIAALSGVELLAFAKTLLRSARRMHWRRLGAARTSMVARGLRLLEKNVASFTRREKKDGGWTIFARDDKSEEVRVAELELNAVRRVDDFRKNEVTVVVHRADLVDVSRLQADLEKMELKRLASRGKNDATPTSSGRRRDERRGAGAA